VVENNDTATAVQIKSQRSEWIPNRWYGVLFSRELLDKPKKIRRFDLDLALFRDSKGKANCLVDVCPHRGVELSAGKIIRDNLTCPFHGFQFDGRGVCQKIPCNPAKKQIPTVMRAGHFPLREEHGIIWLWWGAVMDDVELPAPPWFLDVEVEKQFSSSISFDWASPFPKTIESNFDHHHAPVLHGPGRGDLGKQTEAHDFNVRREGEVLFLTGRLQEPTSDGAFHPKGYDLQAKVALPGLSYIVIGRYIRLLVVDSPVDDTTTHRLVTYLNHFFRVPVIGKAVISLFRMVDMPTVQRAEDEPVVRTMGRYPDFPERLVAADIAVGQIKKMQKAMMDSELENLAKLPFWVQRQLKGSPLPNAALDRKRVERDPEEEWRRRLLYSTLMSVPVPPLGITLIPFFYLRIRKKWGVAKGTSVSSLVSFLISLLICVYTGWAILH
jgi:phenylpropionate dioxygenase-like ring-hydroxylating dioxygenase large terminal subunit